MTDKERDTLIFNIGGIDACLAIVEMIQNKNSNENKEELLNRLHENLVDISRSLKELGDFPLEDALFMM